MRYVDCTQLLDDLSHAPLINDMITWGKNQPPPGNIPVSLASDSCRLDLYARHPRRTETESFRLATYYEDLRQVNERCLKGNPDYNRGMVGIGEEMKFFAYLGPA